MFLKEITNNLVVGLCVRYVQNAINSAKYSQIANKIIYTVIDANLVFVYSVEKLE